MWPLRKERMILSNRKIGNKTKRKLKNGNTYTRMYARNKIIASRLTLVMRKGKNK